MRRAGFAYAQARMQARYAARPTALDWQLIQTGRSYAQCLDAVNRTALAPLVAQLGRDSSAAAIERALVERWGEVVVEIAHWVPRPWQPPVLWFAPLPHLRVLAGTEPPLGLPGAGALAAEVEAGGELDAAWAEGFCARLPSARAVLCPELAPLIQRFRKGMPRRADDTPALIDRLERLFRRNAQTPMAALAYLGISALDIERLRGALLVAILLPLPDLRTGEEEAA